mmetsp:Transcript_53592/g.135353  ORF Transcript_53592/g.135353 Transcript_53592/m.135353 type:complete len:261 (+) Transcript_53592:1563-2345(+)
MKGLIRDASWEEAARCRGRGAGRALQPARLQAPLSARRRKTRSCGCPDQGLGTLSARGLPLPPSATWRCQRTMTRTARRYATSSSNRPSETGMRAPLAILSILRGVVRAQRRRPALAPAPRRRHQPWPHRGPVLVPAAAAAAGRRLRRGSASLGRKPGGTRFRAWQIRSRCRCPGLPSSAWKVWSSLRRAKGKGIRRTRPRRRLKLHKRRGRHPRRCRCQEPLPKTRTRAIGLLARSPIQFWEEPGQRPRRSDDQASVAL